MIARGPGGELVGTDGYGNKYFEKKDAILNRDRWVVFANSTHYTGQNPTVVPPEWHGWLHFITDDNPATVRFEFRSIRFEFDRFCLFFMLGCIVYRKDGI